MTHGSLLEALALAFTLQAPDPRAAVAELLAADRAFASAAAELDLPSALSAMFAEDVLMPEPGGSFVEGREAARAALESNPANLGARAVWTPVRGGVSADGLHGFTLGYMEITAADGSQRPAKYLAYWVKGGMGWRVAGYKRAPRAPGEVSLEPLPPALPARMVQPSTEDARREGLGASLMAAERAFSDEAQRIGLGPAFEKYGSADATNMGGPDSPAFVVGATNIARAVGGDATGPSPVRWSADRVLVASSGDLGITFGMIRPHQPVAGQPAAFPFFTIWRRASADEPWRYVAE